MGSVHPTQHQPDTATPWAKGAIFRVSAVVKAVTGTQNTVQVMQPVEIVD